MTSPYLEREAAKLRLVHSAPRREPNIGASRIGASADHDPRDFRYPRTQREAGVEHLEWEDRIPAIRPWMFFAISGVCWVILGAGIAWMLSAL